MKLDLRPMLAGERHMSFDYALELDTEEKDLLCSFFGADFPSPMKVSGNITNTAGYMRMVAELSIDYEASCSRCLSPISGSFTFNLEKTVASKDMLEDLPEEKLDEYVVVEDGFLDFDEQLKEELYLEFPSRLLCREDCKGLCRKCGKNLNDGACGCPEKEMDPRLAPLKDLLEKFKEEK